MHRIGILLTCCLFASVIRAQTTEDSIKVAVQMLFKAMKESDSAALTRAFSPTAVLQTIGRSKDGTLSVSSEKVEDFAASISKAPRGALDERIEFAAIQIDGPMASVWTPYHFYYQGKFSHCGVNSFQLVRMANGWKIQYIIDTRRRDGCQPE